MDPPLRNKDTSLKPKRMSGRVMKSILKSFGKDDGLKSLIEAGSKAMESPSNLKLSEQNLQTSPKDNIVRVVNNTPSFNIDNSEDSWRAFTSFATGKKHYI